MSAVLLTGPLNLNSILLHIDTTSSPRSALLFGDLKVTTDS